MSKTLVEVPSSRNIYIEVINDTKPLFNLRSDAKGSSHPRGKDMGKLNYSEKVAVTSCCISDPELIYFTPL